MNRLLQLFERMTDYEKGVPQRQQHFLKVTAYAKIIAELEQVDEATTETLLAAALVHDCGIRPSLEKYESDGGEYQQIEGPPVAEQLLREVGFEKTVIERVCYLVGHHHTYHTMDGLDHQILVEADFLVNLFEGNSGAPQIIAARTRIFRTAAGIRLLDRLFLAEHKAENENAGF